MKIDLVKGKYPKNAALDLVSQLVQTKIRFLENQIQENDNEEDIKQRERRIVELQNTVKQLREEVAGSDQEFIALRADVFLGE